MDYRRGARFDDVLAITVWADWVRAASLRMGCVIYSEAGDALAAGATEHALVNGEGRPRRLPPATRAALAALAVRAAP
jgi:acyl-CoA thioesterase FadM